jgi:ketol-acid reductoisomerase
VRKRADRAGIAVGAVICLKTDLKKVFSDSPERGTLMGCIQGVFAAQYHVLRERGHSPEAFNETVEELTQFLAACCGKWHGLMYANCSTTAQRGALEWKKAPGCNIACVQ